MVPQQFRLSIPLRLPLAAQRLRVTPVLQIVHRMIKCILLDQLCRYITRPALIDERVQINSVGHMQHAV